MSLGTTDPPRRPLESVPPRAPGSVRRTMHVDVGARIEWGVALPVCGGARDLLTPLDPSSDPVVEAAAHLEAAFDTERRLVELAASPPPAWLGALIGTRAGGGFRRRLEELVPSEDAGSLVRQVLDDLPAAVLISGYAFMRLARRQGFEPSSLTPPNVLDRMVDLCSGWRAGGIAALSIGSGHGVPMQDTPPAPSLLGADPLAWHDMPDLPSDHMRRRRCLDVAPAEDGSLTVWAMFRDTVGEPDGGESVLHEYAVDARIVDGIVEAISAEPRVLPFPECPGAAGHVGELAGMAVADLPLGVPDTLSGIASCTHLNDLLRALGGLGVVVERFSRAG
ncbi:MAG: DUF2889 domain-containing protein [Acidimicrobiales bacterium]